MLHFQIRPGRVQFCSENLQSLISRNKQAEKNISPVFYGICVVKLHLFCEENWKTNDDVIAKNSCPLHIFIAKIRTILCQIAKKLVDRRSILVQIALSLPSPLQLHLFSLYEKLGSGHDTKSFLI